MKYYDPTSSAWEDIIGWFWVNSSAWSITITGGNSVYYDRNDSITITVKDGADDVTIDGWIDVWNVAGTAHTLVYHKQMAANADGMVWEISPANMWLYTHSNGAGVYRITAYEDIDPPHGGDPDGRPMYGYEGRI